MEIAKVDKEEILDRAERFLPEVETFDPDLIEFLKGEVDGAGISFREAFYLRCSYELVVGSVGHLFGQCTSFAATGEATKDGKTIIGQNIDFCNDDFPFEIVKMKHESGLEQLVLYCVGVDYDGLNSHGIAKCMNGTMNEGLGFSLPYGCYLAKVLRQKSIGQSLGVLMQSVRGLLYHVMASAEGDIVGFESVSDAFKILHPENDILVHSNHYLTKEFQKADLMYTALSCFPDTFLRFHRVKRLMQRRHGEITAEVMMGILADHNNYPYSICRHPDTNLPPEFQSATLASVIMVPGERKMFVANGNPCQCEYVEYQL